MTDPRDVGAPRRPWRTRGTWLPRALLVALCLQVAVYCVRPMVSYRAIGVGASTAQLGVIVACFGALSLVCAIPVGRGVDRWGPGPFLVLGAVTVAITATILTTSSSLVVLGLATMLLGLGHIQTTVALQTLLANHGAPGRRDERFAALTVTVSVGQLVGPALGGMIAGQGVGNVVGHQGHTAPAAGMTTVFAVGAGVAVVAGLFAATLFRAGRPASRTSAGSESPPPRFSLWRTLRLPQMPQAMLASVAVLTSTDVLVAYLPVYGHAVGLSVRTVGFLLAALAAGAMVSRFCMRLLIRQMGRGRLLALSAAVPAVVLAVFPLFHDAAVLFPAMAVAGLGLGLGQPLSLAWVAANSPRELRGTAIGVRLSGNRLGQIVVPAVVGALAGVTGLAAVFWSLTAMLASSAVLNARASFEPSESAEGTNDGEATEGNDQKDLPR